MFTVKLVKASEGYEGVFPAKTVYRTREGVSVESPEGDIIFYHEGDFWVMNENGKTVADYHLWVPEGNFDVSNEKLAD